MMASGIPIERVRDWVGHSDIRTTVNIYGHLEYHSKMDAAKAIGEALAIGVKS
jgi:integrase